MKFAIPLAEGKLTAHFGHCQEFAIVEVEDNEIKNKETLVPRPMNPVCCQNGFTIWVPM